MNSISRWLAFLMLCSATNMNATAMSDIRTERQSVSSKALATIRPGMTREAVQNIYGPAWRTPPPHRRGKNISLERAKGFAVQFDKTGHVGSATFNEHFDHTVAIGGLKIHMTPNEVRSVIPDIKIAGSDHMSFVLHRRDDGILLSLDFSNARLENLRLWKGNAVYPPPAPVSYPAPVGKPGAPFKDPNFKLAVMSELLEMRLIDIGEPEDLARHVLKRPVDLETEGYAFIPQAHDYLTRYPLTQDLLDLVTTIEIDAGAEILTYAFNFYDGESDEFDINSFEGIAHLRNLRSISIISLTKPDIDLGPIKRMKTVDIQN